MRSSSLFLVLFPQSEIAVSAHASREISHISMGTKASLFRCEFLIIAGLAHAFAIVNACLMRTVVNFFSSPGATQLSSFHSLYLLGLIKLFWLQCIYFGRISRHHLKILTFDRLEQVLNHIGVLILSYMVRNSFSIDFEIEAGSLINL